MNCLQASQTKLGLAVKLQTDTLTLICTAVGDWRPCGDSYFTRHELYQMAWGEQDLSTKRCMHSGKFHACASAAG